MPGRTGILFCFSRLKTGQKRKTNQQIIKESLPANYTHSSCRLIKRNIQTGYPLVSFTPAKKLTLTISPQKNLRLHLYDHYRPASKTYLTKITANKYKSQPSPPHPPDRITTFSP
jgi:hypothetical protein